MSNIKIASKKLNNIKLVSGSAIVREIEYQRQQKMVNVNRYDLVNLICVANIRYQEKQLEKKHVLCEKNWVLLKKRIKEK